MWFVLYRDNKRRERERDGWMLGKGTSYLEGEIEMTWKIEGVKRGGSVPERRLKTERRIGHNWRDWKKRARWTKAWGRERDRMRERREGTRREIVKGSGGIMTKWQEDDRSMGHFYPQERESDRDGGESGGEEATVDWRVTLFTARRRDWGILMWGGRREMKRDSLG